MKTNSFALSKKKHFFKRTVSMILVLVMVVAILPVISLPTTAAENINYIDNGDFDILGHGFNALSGTGVEKEKLCDPIIDPAKASGSIMNINSTEGEVKTYDSMSSLLQSFNIGYENSQSANVNISIAKAGVERKFAVDFSTSQQTVYKASFLTYTIDATRNQYRLADNYSDMLSENFLRAVKNLSAEELFEKYGTHMLVRYNNGGRAYLSAYAYTTEKNTSFSSSFETSYSVSGGVTVGKYGADATVANTISLGYINEGKASNIQTGSQWYLLGGDANLPITKTSNGTLDINQDDMNAWVDSLNEHPVMIPETSEWVPIWEILPPEYKEEKATLYDAYVSKSNDVVAEFFKKYSYYTGTGVSDKYTYISKSGMVFPDVTYERGGAEKNPVGPGSVIIPQIGASDDDGTYSKEYKVVGANATVDSKKGILKIDSNAAEEQAVTLQYYRNGNLADTMSFYIINDGTVNGNKWFGAGYGTKDRPYIINTAYKFSHLSEELCYGKEYYYELIADLDFSEISNEKPIPQLLGGIEGNGFTIKNWYYKSSLANKRYADEYNGIVAHNQGFIQNLNIEDCSIILEAHFESENYETENVYVGMLCGFNEGKIDNVAITNAKVEALMSSAWNSNDYSLALNKVYGGIISGKTASSSITTYPIQECGVKNSTIFCKKYGERDEKAASSYVGAISGTLTSGAKIKNTYSYNNGITAEAGTHVFNFDRYACAGGIIGELDENAEIDKSIAFNNKINAIQSWTDGHTYETTNKNGDTVTISSPNRQTAGIFTGRYASGTIKNTYTKQGASGSLTGRGNAYDDCTLEKYALYNGKITQLSAFTRTVWCEKDDGTFNPQIVQPSGQTVDISNADLTFVACPASSDVLPNYVDLSKIDVIYSSNPNPNNVGEVSKNYRIKPTINYKEEGTQNLTIYGYARAESVITVTGVKKAATKIELRQPNKTLYYEGEQFSTDGMYALIYYNDGSVKEVAGSKLTTSGFSSKLTDPTRIFETKTVTVSYEGLSATFDVEVYKISSQRLTITSLPKTNYYVGEGLDYSGIKLELMQNNGKKISIDASKLNSSNFSGFDNSQNAPENQTITVTYSGVTAEYDIVMLTNQIVDLKLKSNPQKLIYFVGDYGKIDTTGIKLTATYEDGTQSIISSGFECSDIDTSTTGYKTVELEYYGYTVDFPVEVKPVEAVSIEIADSSVHKTKYYIGDTFTGDGIALSVTYNNGKTATVWDGFTYKVENSTEGSSPMFTSSGEKRVVVYYIDGGNKCSAIYNVNISPVSITSIEISQYPVKQYYIPGEELNTYGLIVRINKNNGSSEIVTPTDFRYDFSNPGKQSVAIDYLGYTTTFDVTVLSPSSLSIQSYPQKLSYEEGEEFASDGMGICVNYANGKTFLLSEEEYSISVPDMSQVGEQEVVISYLGLSISFEINIYEHKLTEDDPQVRVEESMAHVGTTVTLDITMANVENVKSILIDNFEYDAKGMSLVNFEWMVDGAIISNWDSSLGVGTVAFDKNTNVDGVIARATFKVNDNADVGNVEVSCSVVAKKAVDGGGEEEVSMAFVPGAITITTIARGDVNGDFFVDSNDAIYLLRHTLNSDKYIINQSGDMNGDGVVNSDDAVYLLRYTLNSSSYPLK